MKTSSNRILTTSITLALAAVAGSALAGPLNPPPGPITSTMKPLGDVEPRTVINSTNTPGDATNMFVISQPGSYYLSGNVAVSAGKNGIKITSSHVTLDLNGFTVYGFSGSLDGITTSNVFQMGIKIKNGIVRTFGLDGIDLTGSVMTWPQSVVIENVQSTDNSDHGIRINDGQVRDCIVLKNRDKGLVAIANHSTFVRGVTARDNGTGGIYTVLARIQDCVAEANGVTGIHVDNRGDVISCTSNGNTTGFYIGSGSLRDSTAINNSSAGVFMTGLCENNLFRNEASLGNFGIRINGAARTVVKGNQVVGFTSGIDGAYSSDLIFSNYFTSCTTAISGLPNLRVGTINNATLTPVSGNSGGGLGTTDPYANIIH
ncbi:MAG: right-handed parallel beta-helix repeat-containing protein [Planctomycetes bacterium]|nr:right-handed parallel beta-helix repeat-containing protein [Planctomycetota bacterium]